jgi:hypothetical protein
MGREEWERKKIREGEGERITNMKNEYNSISNSSYDVNDP